MKKVENLQKRTLRFLQNEYHSFYETLLHKSGKTTVNVRNLRNQCKEIFESLGNLNPVFLKEIFYFREWNRSVREKYKLNLQITKVNQVRFGTKSLRGLGPKIWNTLPYHIKTSESTDMFIKTIKNRNGVECKLQLLTFSYLLSVVRSTYLLLTYLFFNVLYSKGTFKKYVRSRFPNFDHPPPPLSALVRF